MDIGPPVAPGFVVVLGGDVVAEADAGGGVEAFVGLFVDLARAVGVGGD